MLRCFPAPKSGSALQYGDLGSGLRCKRECALHGDVPEPDDDDAAAGKRACVAELVVHVGARFRRHLRVELAGTAARSHRDDHGPSADTGTGSSRFRADAKPGARVARDDCCADLVHSACPLNPGAGNLLAPLRHRGLSAQLSVSMRTLQAVAN